MTEENLTSEVENVEQDELSVLKERAKAMNIQFHPSIGLENLKAKVEDHLKAKEPIVADRVEEAPAVESKHQTIQRLRKEASKLIRIEIACMNPNKKEWEGEVFTGSNSIVGTHKKYVPFNTPWHVPKIIYNIIKERQCQIFKTEKGPRGNKIRKGHLISEFAIKELDPLTKDELEDLATQQAMANNLD